MTFAELIEVNGLIRLVQRISSLDTTIICQTRSNRDTRCAESLDGVFLEGDDDDKDGAKKSTKAAIAPETVVALAGMILGAGRGSV
jgi:hypothetical protein